MQESIENVGLITYDFTQKVLKGISSIMYTTIKLFEMESL